MSECKGNCGFFGSDQYEGYCSKCYRTIVKGEVEVPKTQRPNYHHPPTPTFSSEEEFQVFVRLIKDMPELSSKKIDTVLQTLGVYFTEEQARRLLAAIGKEDLQGSDNFIYHHAVYCRVTDRWHLASGYGAEGYYHVEEGVKPPDNYQVWDHQHSFLK